MVADKGIGRALGIATDKEKVGKALLEEDRASAIKDDESINRYNRLNPEKKQSYFKAESDPALKQQLIKIDQAAAEKENAERDQKTKDAREESEGKMAVYNASTGERRQSVYNNALDTGERSRVKYLDEERARESNAKGEVYNASVGERRQAIYTRDLNTNEQERVRSTDESEARKIDTSRGSSSGGSTTGEQVRPTTPIRPTPSADSSVVAQSRPIVTPQSTVINDNSSVVAEGATINSTTNNTTNINNGAKSSLPSGYVINPSGRLAVPSSTLESPTSSFQSGGKSAGSSISGGLVSTEVPRDSKALEQESDSIVASLTNMSEQERAAKLEELLPSMHPEVAKKVRSKLAEIRNSHDPQHDDLTHLFE
jgi:hypothetical protein